MQTLAGNTLALMGLGWIIWRATDPQPAWRAILFMLGGLTLLAAPAEQAITHLVPERMQWIASWALLLALLAYLARALRVVSGHRQQRAVAR